MNITSDQARDMIPVYDQHDICVELRRRGYDSGQLAEKTMWLVYLCAKGDINRVVEFIESTNHDELRGILNKKLSDNYDGTVLNTVLYWNTGNKALDLFELLVEHGADPVRDYYGNFPWENTAPLWVVPFGVSQIGYRNMDVFEETYQYLCDIYDPSLNSEINVYMNQNASPIAAPEELNDIDSLVDQLENTNIVPRRLDFDFDLVYDKSSIDKKVIDFDDEIMDDCDYSDMPALVDSDDEDEYADMPPLESDGDDDEYADMPALVSVPETRLVYSDDDEFYD